MKAKMDVDLVDAAKRLEELVDRALAGEVVNIIDGKWVVRLLPEASSTDAVALVARDTSLPDPADKGA